MHGDHVFDITFINTTGVEEKKKKKDAISKIGSQQQNRAPRRALCSRKNRYLTYVEFLLQPAFNGEKKLQDLKNCMNKQLNYLIITMRGKKKIAIARCTK